MDFNLGTMLVESARRTPDKAAVILDDVRITYTQLDALSDRVAANLSAAGVAPGAYLRSRHRSGVHHV